MGKSGTFVSPQKLEPLLWGEIEEKDASQYRGNPM